MKFVKCAPLTAQDLQELTDLIKLLDDCKTDDPDGGSGTINTFFTSNGTISEPRSIEFTGAENASLDFYAYNNDTLTDSNFNMNSSTLSLSNSRSDLIEGNYYNELRFTDKIVFQQFPANGGVRYEDDYSATFVERSLVDKAYVDLVAATADNVALLDEQNIFTAQNVFNGNVVMLGDGSDPNIFNNATQHNGVLTVSGGLNSNGNTSLAGTLDFSGTMTMGGTISYTNVVTDTVIDNASDDILINKRWFNNNIPATAGSGELELITEGGNSGYTFKNRNTANYGDIGNNAVDFSISSTSSNTHGATGENSFAANFRSTANTFYAFAANVNTLASGIGSTAFGSNTIASSDNAFAANQTNTASGTGSSAFGVLNTAAAHGEMVVGVNAEIYTPQSINNYDENDRVFAVGVGSDGNAINRADGLRVFKTGLVELPKLTDTLIDSSVNAAVTKQYADNNYSKSIKTFTGSGSETSSSLNTSFPFVDNPVTTIVLDTTNFELFIRVSSTDWRQINLTTI